MAENFLFAGLAGNVRCPVETDCLSRTMDSIKSTLCKMDLRPAEREWKQLAVMHDRFNVTKNGRRHQVTINLKAKTVTVR